MPPDLDRVYSGDDALPAHLERMLVDDDAHRTCPEYKSRPARLEQMLERGALHYPSKTAISYLDGGEYKQVSYNKLHIRVQRLANVLEPKLPRVLSNDTPFIGLFLGRGVEQVTAIFASFAVGAAYVPVAPDSTHSAFRSILDQTRMRIIITDSSQRGRLAHLMDQVACTDIAVVDVSDADQAPIKPFTRALNHATTASAAYVLFSSGTTGAPKGIVNSHAAVRTYCTSGNKYFRITSEDKWVRAAAYTFDASVEELFCPLSVGAEIVIQPDGALSSFPTYLNFLSQSGATAVSMTTALWHQFANFVVQEKQQLPPSLRLIVIGGEAAMTSVLKAWRKTVGDYPRFLNTYGATEATVSTTIWEGQDNIDGPVLPIGRPLADYMCFVLDPSTNLPVEPGQDGVLFVSGPAVAIGYLDEALTHKRFVPNPWAESAAYNLMYNTGDVVRVDEDGMYWFRGRIDLQAKARIRAFLAHIVRGYLVEIEAIEACLLNHPRVLDAAVAISVEQQTNAINAYIVETTHSDLDPLCSDDLTEHCRRNLAPYEVPTRFYSVEKMPYTPHRKVDRRALKSQEFTLLPFRDGPIFDVPAGDVNPALADLWSQCLENVVPAKLNSQSNFIHLGGHSLTMITLAAKIHTTLGVHLTAVDLLRNPTLGGMSHLLNQYRTQSPESPRTEDSIELRDGSTHPLSLPQARLYAVQQNSPDSPFFNDGVAIQIVGQVDGDKIRTSMETILRRHIILRTRLVQDQEAQLFQEILPFSEELFEDVFSHLQLEPCAARERAVQVFSQPFDLFQSPPFKVALLSSGNEQHILVVCAHHIVWDGVSDSIFLRELVSLYQGQDLPPPSHYLQCFSTQQTSSEKLSALISYLDSVPHSLNFPVDFVRPERQTYSRGRSVYFDIDSHVVSRLVEHSGGTSVSCMMTAFAVAIHLFTVRQQDFVIGVPFANRLSSQAAAAIGFFINVLPLRVRLGDDSAVSDLHRTISEDLLFIAEKQDVPLDELVKVLGLNRFTSSDSLIQSSFTFQDAPEGTLDHQATFSRFPLSNGAARTDLMCLVEVGKDGALYGELEYDSGIFAHENMVAFVSAFTRVLDAWSAQPGILIDEIVFVEGCAHVPAVAHLGPTEQSVGAFLASLALPHLDCLAVYDDTTETSYTYRDLYSRAAHMQRLVRPYKKDEGAVILLLERSIDVIAAQIGVNLAGMAWVPCDVKSPLSRIQDIVVDADPVCIVAHGRALENLGAGEAAFSVPVILVDGSSDEIKSVENVEVDSHGKAAYVIYTSGSTGKPKGVVLGHESVISYIVDTASWSRGGKPFHCILTANIAWDASLSHIYPALATGGCVKLPKLGGETNGEYLSGLMKSDPPTNVFGTTSAALKMWLDQASERLGTFFPHGMLQIMLGGDEITTTFIKRVFVDVASSRDVQVRHIYGPTEGTVLSSYGILTHSNLGSLGRRRRVPIDIAMPHASMTVVNRAGNELPRGFVGEIVIWGTCLLLEYRNLSVINAQRLLIKDGVRGWRSGDLGRHLSTGQFEIFGRTDSMCKVKGGFRVELPEIEAQIRSYPDVDDCCVSLTDPSDASGEASERRIVAHVVFKGHIRQDDHVIEDWKQVFGNATLADGSVEEQVDLSFDYRGWTSSLGRRKFTLQEMTEWIDTTVARLLELDCFESGKRPRVLEIGSGTGMILFRIAHLCETYTGVDLLPSAVAQVKAHSLALGLDNVDVHVSPAHLFSQSLPDDAQFDLIICNSVIQYFPSLAYLQTVIDCAGDRLSPGGILFVGDVRNYALASQFFTAQAISLSPRSVSELQNTITVCARTEQELLVDPSYFIQLARDSTYFETATTILHRGVEATDMTLFRYDTILRSSSASTHISSTAVNIALFASDSLSHEDTLDQIVMSPKPALVQSLLNKRIVEFHYISTQPLGRFENLPELLSAAKHAREGSAAYDLESTIVRVSQGAGVRAIPICSLSHPECFDLLVVDTYMPQHELARLCFDVQLHSLDNITMREASNKPRITASKQTLTGLYDYLSHRIPSYMIPDFVVFVETLPLTSSHKVNKAKLPVATHTDRFVASTSVSAEWSAEDEARRPVVEAILKVFSSVLFIDKPLSPKDNFFLCGGHSLVATKAISLIRRELNVDLPFTAIITSPSASDLAACVEALKQESENTNRVANIISLQSKPVPQPKAMLFVFPRLFGQLDMLPEVVSKLDNDTLGLATYGLVWEPGQDLNTLKKVADAYAKSISTIAESTPCFLLGWCYGGMIASEVARRLPKDTTKILLLNSPALAVVCEVQPDDSDHPDTFINRICALLDPTIPDLSQPQSVRKQAKDKVDRGKLTRALQDAKIDWHDAPRLIAFTREHIELPEWMTDSELNRCIIPLADSSDVLIDLYENYSPASFNIAETEEQVILNLQHHTPHEGLTQGLGWSRYEIVGSDRTWFAYLPEVLSRMVAALREHIPA